jgi:AsmA protein
MRLRGWVLTIVAVVVVLPVAAVTVFLLAFNPNAYAPRIVGAVAAATGRQLTLGSPITIELSLTPTIEASHVSLANAPGFADANFATLQQVQAQIALLPLLSHHLDIKRLVLVGPAVNLETDKAGNADWDFSRPPPPATAPATLAAAPAGPDQNYKISLEAVELRNGQVIVKNTAGQQTGALAIADLTGTADSPSAPLNIQAQAAYNGAPFTLSGQLGPVERFSGIGSGPWPVDLSVAANNATATVNGTVRHPRDGTGYDLALTAAVPALEAFQPWAGSAFALPPVHGLTAAAHLRDQGAPMPAITGFFVKAAASDLTNFRPGLALTNLDVEMPSLAQPLNVNITGTLNNAPVSLTGSIGAVAALLNPAWLPAPPATANPQSTPPVYPVNLQAQAGAAKLSITGGVATPAGLSGVALGVTASIPDLGALSPLAGQPLPAWKNIALQATVIDPGGLGLAKSAGLDGLTLSMDNATLGGDASVYFGPQPKLELALKGGQINLDALLAAIPAPSPATPAPAATLNAPPSVQTGDFTQSKIALPVKLMQAASADIQLSADTLVFNKATYTALQTHAVLANGALTINPLTAILPGGSVAANATIDATKTPATETISINAPALALGPFLKAIDVPDDAEGTVEATLNANGAGDTPHDFFAGINGQLGLASVNGQVDGAVLDALFGAVLRAVGLPASVVGAQGPVAMRCFALRVDAAAGIGTIRALTLDSSRLMLQGGGTVGFGDETLNIIMRPQLRVAGADLGVPVQIGGTFDNPTTTLATISALQEAGKAAVGLPVTIVQKAANSNGFLGQVVNGLGLNGVIGNGAQPDPCPAALALGRLGQPGPAPEAPVADTPAAAGAKPPSGPQNLLNSLFGK